MGAVEPCSQFPPVTKKCPQPATKPHGRQCSPCVQAMLHRHELSVPVDVVERGMGELEAGCRMMVACSVQLWRERRMDASELESLLQSVAWQSTTLRAYFDRVSRKRQSDTREEFEVLSSDDMLALLQGSGATDAKRARNTRAGSPAKPRTDHDGDELPPCRMTATRDGEEDAPGTLDIERDLKELAIWIDRAGQNTSASAAKTHKRSFQNFDHLALGQVDRYSVPGTASALEDAHQIPPMPALMRAETAELSHDGCRQGAACGQPKMKSLQSSFEGHGSSGMGDVGATESQDRGLSSETTRQSSPISPIDSSWSSGRVSEESVASRSCAAKWQPALEQGLEEGDKASTN